MKKYDWENVGREHVMRAMDYIDNNGKPGKCGWHLLTAAQFWSIATGGKRYAPKDLLRVAYYFYAKRTSGTPTAEQIAQDTKGFTSVISATTAREFIAKLDKKFRPVK